MQDGAIVAEGPPADAVTEKMVTEVSGTPMVCPSDAVGGSCG
jgi:hypothetical protein